MTRVLILFVILAALGALCLWVGWLFGVRYGTEQTERRWSNAVARADDARAKALTPRREPLRTIPVRRSQVAPVTTAGQAEQP